jgi:MIP family channel proteins
MRNRLGASLLVEFIGTFALVFCGMLVFYHGKPAGLPGLLVIALGHGLILSVMVTAAMPTSGGHFNPAVTIGFLAARKIKALDALSYIVVQLLASVAAALLVYVAFGAVEEAGKIVQIGVPDFDKLNPATAVVIEAIATFFLVFAVWGSAADPRARNVGGFAIGLTVAADILAFGPLTQASMNPARSFGPTLVAALVPGGTADWLWPHHWVYWVGPVAGGIIAALIYSGLLMPEESA